MLLAVKSKQHGLLVATSRAPPSPRRIKIQTHAQVCGEQHRMQQLKQTRRSIPELWTTPVAQMNISTAGTSSQLPDLSWILLSPPVGDAALTDQAGELEKLHGAAMQSVNGTPAASAPLPGTKPSAKPAAGKAAHATKGQADSSHAAASGSSMTKIQSSAGHPNATCATSQERRHLPASRHLEKQRTHAIVHSHKQIGFHNACEGGPALAGVVAAGSVLLAAVVWRWVRGCQAEGTHHQVQLQQQQLQGRAEGMAAQRLRYLQAVDVEQLAGSAGASLPGGGNSADYLSSAAAADVDADAARQYQMFMAGAKVSTAKMWSSSSLRDLPKLSQNEMEHQTQKIRAAASKEEQAAVGDVKLQWQMAQDQLSSQLAELDEAPVGRAAREAWRRERQQLKQQQQEQSHPAGSASTGGTASGGSTAEGSSNPFMTSSHVREQWASDDHTQYADHIPRPLQNTPPWFDLGGSRQQSRKQQQQVEVEPLQHTQMLAAAATAAEQQLKSDCPPNSSSHVSRAQQLADTRPSEGKGPEGVAKLDRDIAVNHEARRARRASRQQQPTASAILANGENLASFLTRPSSEPATVKGRWRQDTALDGSQSSQKDASRRRSARLSAVLTQDLSVTAADPAASAQAAAASALHIKVHPQSNIEPQAVADVVDNETVPPQGAQIDITREESSAGKRDTSAV